MFSFFKKKDIEEVRELKAFLSGKAVPIEEVPDQVFSAKIMGDGIAIWPASDTVVAPADGEVTAVMEDSKHACGMKLGNRMELFLHVGLDTMDMRGDGFELHVKLGDKVKAGQPLFSFDMSKIEAAGHPAITILAVTDEGAAKNIRYRTGMQTIAGETVIASIDE